MKLVNIYEDGSGLLHLVEKRERNTFNARTGPSVGIRRAASEKISYLEACSGLSICGTTGDVRGLILLRMCVQMKSFGSVDYDILSLLTPVRRRLLLRQMYPRPYKAGLTTLLQVPTLQKLLLLQERYFSRP